MILSSDNIVEFRVHLRHPRLVATSGGFDPIHQGHIAYLEAAAELGSALLVIVNGDTFLRAKKGRPFQDLQTRCRIVNALRCVDYVVPFEIAADPTVNVALEKIRPRIFAKGGDRADAATIPEWETCQRLGIRVVTGVGGTEKVWSSSRFLRAWTGMVETELRRTL